MYKRQVPREHKASYLGTLLTDTVSNKQEINSRIADVQVTSNRLGIFWDKADTTKEWKIRVYTSIIKSKLLYGLETIQLTTVEQNRINAIQMAGLRRILKLPSTYEDRTYSNKYILDLIKDQYKMKILTFQESWRRRKVKLLGHIIRAKHSDPLRQVIFQKGTDQPRTEYKKRTGKPRDKWLE